jgi:glutaredoxin
MKIRCIVLAAAALAAAAAASGQVLYKSIGPDGKVSYTDRPPAQGSVEKTLKIDDLPNTALPTKTLAELEQLRQKAAKGAAQASTTAAGKGDSPPVVSGVTLFAASWCGYCRKARAYLAQKQVAYQEVDIDTPDGKMAFVQAGGQGGIPLLLARGRKLRGFSEPAYDDLFAVRR